MKKTPENLDMETDPKYTKWLLFMGLISNQLDDDPDIFHLFSLLTGIPKKEAEEMHKRSLEGGHVEEKALN